MKGLQLSGAVLLLVSGVILLIPALYQGLSAVTAGRPWIQIIVGIVGIIVSLALFAGKPESAS
ncbi:MAG: hypothetical protein G01um101438_404 [Parcubacteria group bacterium Gr01-1014_38]|nr:MAG: hypothetical protein G01um101438_404 [Parcubacteria group bacterium Gr01-1014_38]